MANDADESGLDPAWEEALGLAATSRRIMVAGPTDVGKSRFILELGRLRPDLILIDLDPGQKMIGAPGTASLGRLAEPDRPERFVWLGSSAVTGFRHLGEAAAALAQRAFAPWAANLPGYVTGPGLALQHRLAAALAPDLVVLIAPLDRPVALEASEGAAMIKLPPSAAARRKSPAQRRRNREARFAAVMAGAATFRLPAPRWSPAPPRLFTDAARPVCAIADEAGEDRRLCVLVGLEDDMAMCWGAPPDFTPASVRLGSLWAAPRGDGWQLLEPLAPAWDANTVITT